MKKKIPSDGPLPWPSVDARLVPNAPLIYPLTCLTHGTCATYPRAAVTVCTRTTCDLARAATHVRRAWHTSRRMPCTCHKARYAPHVTCSHNTCGAYVTVPPCTCQAMECQALSCNLCREPIFNHKNHRPGCASQAETLVLQCPTQVKITVLSSSFLQQLS